MPVAVEIVKAFGKAVKLRRIELDLTQEDLVERSGLARSFVSSIERGQKSASVTSIAALADALQCNPSDLWRVAERLRKDEPS